MSLKDYAVPRDHFVYEPCSLDRDFAFPCCVCKHNSRRDTEHPCRVCDHSATAVPAQPEEVKQS